MSDDMAFDADEARRCKLFIVAKSDEATALGESVPAPFAKTKLAVISALVIDIDVSIFPSNSSKSLPAFSLELPPLPPNADRTC